MTFIVTFDLQAESLKTTQIDEDGLLELIAKRPGKKSKYEIAAEKELKVVHWPTSVG